MQGTNINASLDNIDADDFENCKVYAVLSSTGGTLNHPNTGNNFLIITLPFNTDQNPRFKFQIGISHVGSIIVTRMRWNGEWSPWYKHTGIVV